MRKVQDRYLPPDHDAFVAAEPPTGRLIVIAPTRAACETIELALGLQIDTYLEKVAGERVRELARSGQGFGIVAGTGTGKTLAIRPIAEEIVGRPLRVGVVNREREATPETPTWNVIIVTTGIARRWFQDGDVLKTDTLVVDEIHQTSAELELCLALGKRTGCRFIWLSATVDPTFYRDYLNSADVVEVHSFDPAKAARVEVRDVRPDRFLGDRFLRTVMREKRGVGVFLPTRASVEEAARLVEERFPRINSAYYHGGEPVRVIRAFLEGSEPKPYVLAMTAAGQSALNVQGLDTVVIDDTRFANVIERGRNVLTKLHLGANEILQMAGRVHGRVEGGRVFILSDREIDFYSLRPTAPEFQLAGDSERVALTCAAIGVRADELELPVPLDRRAYREAVARLEARGVIENGHLSRYGRDVEALPCDRPWAELIVHAEDDLLPFLTVMSSIESLHRMTRDDRDLDGVIVPGSDHLTAYNLYAEAFRKAGYMGEVYGLPRHLFDQERIEPWAERRGVLVKAIEDAALAMASVYRAVGAPLPTSMPWAGTSVYRRFADLLARFMPFDLIIDEETARGEHVRVSRTSVAGGWGAVAGTLRYFADKFGIPRASMEGTQIPIDIIRKYAVRGAEEIAVEPRRKASPLVLRRRVEYFGFELEREQEPLEEWPDDALAERVWPVLGEAMATGQLRTVAVRRNQPIVEEIREVWRRLGGRTRRMGQAELTELYTNMLREADVRSVRDVHAARLPLQRDDWVTEAEVEEALALPDTVSVRGQDMSLHYEVEELPEGELRGVVRLRLPEKVARTLVEEELPEVDRPMRFAVHRGKRGTVRADTLEELQELLDLPWSPEEMTRDRGPYRQSSSGRDGRERGGSRTHRSRAEQRRGQGRSGSRRDDSRKGGARGAAREDGRAGSGRKRGARPPAPRKRRRG